jgi:hypothetical protein
MEQEQRELDRVDGTGTEGGRKSRRNYSIKCHHS